VDVVELSTLPRLVQGLAFAVLQVESELRASAFGTLFERAQHLRRKLRKAADALAEAGLLPDADIDEVWLYGKQDVLEDCLSLVALLRRNEARIAGRSPMTASDIREAEQSVEKLRTMLGQREETSDRGALSLVRVIDMRDRFWTLLKQRHEVLWRCGAWLYGHAVEERVPPLPTRRSLVRKSRGVLVAQEATRTLPEQRRVVPPPPARVERVSPPPSAAPRDSSRHLNDLQRDLERKARFLVRIGVIPPQR
jgi:hypothetical protein